MIRLSIFSLTCIYKLGQKLPYMETLHNHLVPFVKLMLKKDALHNYLSRKLLINDEK